MKTTRINSRYDGLVAFSVPTRKTQRNAHNGAMTARPLIVLCSWTLSGVLATAAVNVGLAGPSAATTSCQEPTSPPADMGAQDNVVTGLAHLSTCSIWEVGYWSDGAGPHNDQNYVGHGLVEHWNGQTWRQLSLPIVGSVNDNISVLGVNGIASYDVWSVGRRGDNVAAYTVAFHWNGHTWTHVPTPSPGTDAELVDVGMHTHGDSWAVGSYTGSSGKRGLIERWNGQKWAVQTTVPAAELAQVAVTRKGKAWAVGQVSRGGKQYGLILHWTGSHWQQQGSSIMPAGSTLLAVSARGSNNVWAVGQQANATRTFALHYTNGRWRRVSTPSVTADTNALVAVATAADGAVWSVSTFEINGVAHSHVLVRIAGSWHDLGCSPSAPNHLTGIAAAKQGEAVAAGFTNSGANSHFATTLCSSAGA